MKKRTNEMKQKLAANKAKRIEETKSIIVQMVLLKNKLERLQLFQTSRDMDEAIKSVGYEFASSLRDK